MAASTADRLVGDGLPIPGQWLLTDHGLDVTLFDKGRALGGRTSRRRVDPFHFDHGAQYFTARDPAFRRQVVSWQKDGVVEVWQGRSVTIGRNGIDEIVTPDERFVGVPGMNGLAKHLAKDLDIVCRVEIRTIERTGKGWTIDDGYDGCNDVFGLIVLAVPAAQAVPLLNATPHLAARVAKVGMSPCWAVHLGFEQPLDLASDAGWASDSPIGWLARNNGKPGREKAESWVLHATRSWSETHLEDTSDEVLADLQEAFRKLTGISMPPSYQAAHRWRYALAYRPLGEPCLLDWKRGIGVCGDWCLAGRVEAAFQSGAALAGRILSKRD